MMPSCSCTVALCTRDRPEAVRHVLADVLAQAPVDAVVWVIDQSAPEVAAGTARWVASLGDARVRVHVPAGDGLPASRNAAIGLAQGRVLIFFDDDARLHPGCIAAHLAAYEDAGVGAVVGRVAERVVVSNAPAGTCDIGLGGRARTNLEGGEAGDVLSLKGANMSFRRLALAGVGGFDPGYGGTAFLEEADLAATLRAAGWRIRFVPSAAVDHLSLPSGGCRAPDVQAAEQARFYNTGRWVARHRPWSVGLVAATFAAIAGKRAVEWADPSAGARLMRALAAGLRS